MDPCSGSKTSDHERLGLPVGGGGLLDGSLHLRPIRIQGDAALRTLRRQHPRIGSLLRRRVLIDEILHEFHHLSERGDGKGSRLEHSHDADVREIGLRDRRPYVPGPRLRKHGLEVILPASGAAQMGGQLRLEFDARFCPLLILNLLPSGKNRLRVDGAIATNELHALNLCHD